MSWVEALFVWSVAKGAGADLLGAMLRQIYPLFLSFADIVGKAMLKGEGLCSTCVFGRMDEEQKRGITIFLR